MSCNRVRIFLSYTETKSGQEDTMAAVRQAIDDIFKEQNIELIDPMRAPVREYAEISEDVMMAIRQSDAIFVVEYPSIPNTALETGVAWAMGIPILHWLPETRPGRERSGLQAYLHYLGGNEGGITLPSDRGDSRYYHFPGDIATNDDSVALFKQQIRLCLSALINGPLSDHAISARRSFRGVMATATRLLKDHSPSRSICWVLNSLMRQQRDYLERDGDKKFVVDESIWPTFLAALNEHKDSAQHVIAVADINSNIEHFWKKGRVQHIVGARIFRLPWTTFFDAKKLSDFLDFACELAGQYAVYVTDSDSRETTIRRTKSGVGGDFVVFENIIGYYEADQFDSTKLVIEYDEARSEILRTAFARALEVSVRLCPDSRAEAVRRDWFKVRRIGVWSNMYAGGDQRDSYYYDNYDKHIRVWVPEYDYLCTSVARAIINHLTLQNLFGRAVVGEVGIGTGAVTQIVARWSDALSQAGIRPLEKYVCVDSSEEMCDAVTKTISQFNRKNYFKITRGLDFQGLRSNVSGNGKYDLICGSLILHYLLEAPAQGEDWTRFAAQLDDILSPNGVAIFGGCYFEEDDEKRHRQLNWWRQSMERKSLENIVVDQFIDGNPEMCGMPSATFIERYSNGKFLATFDGLGIRHSPFGVLTLRRPIKV